MSACDITGFYPTVFDHKYNLSEFSFYSIVFDCKQCQSILFFHLVFFYTLSVTIGNKFKTKDDKFDDLLDGIGLKDLFG